MSWQRKAFFPGVFGILFLISSSVQAEHILTPCQLTHFETQGQVLDLKKYQGKVIYLDFWASWCPPCAKSFPFLNELQREYQAQGLEVIAVNMDEVPEDAQQFLHKHPADFTVVGDLSKQCAKELGVAAMPSSYLIDRKGAVRHVHLGFRKSQASDLREELEQLLTETAL